MPWKRLPRWVLDYGVVAVITIVVLGWLFSGKSDPPPILGPAPQVLLTQTDGTEFDLMARRGSPVLLVFWAEWCGACRSQVEDLNRLHEEQPELAILGVAVDSGDQASVARHAKRHGIEFPVAPADAITLSQYQVSVLPTNVFIDAQGSVTEAVVGALDHKGFSRRLP